MFKTTKAKIIFVIIFSLICIIITTMLILYKNIEIEQIPEDLEEPPKQSLIKDVNGIDLKGTYNKNDLEIEEKSISQGKVEIKYFQISGLRNKVVQDKINNEMEQIAMNCYKEKVKKLDEIINIQVDMVECANFANTISFSLSYFAKIDDDDDGLYQGFQFMNYDLNTGEKITVDKLFTSDAPIENILRQSAYDDFVFNHVDMNLAGDLVVTDYGDIEDEIAEIVNLYKKGKITEFYYTPKKIFILYDENSFFSIDMENFAEHIAIYNRYLNDEFLFESNKIGMKNLYTLTERYDALFCYSNYQKEANYFIDISIELGSADSDEFAKKLLQDKIAKIENEIEKTKQKAREDLSKFYILNYYMGISTNKDRETQQSLTSYWENGNFYEITVHDFEENIEPIIIEYNRNAEGVPTYVYDFSSILKIEPQNTNEYYIPETGEKIVP